MITVMAHPKADKHHIVVEHFKSEIVAEQWKVVLKKNGWVVV